MADLARALAAERALILEGRLAELSPCPQPGPLPAGAGGAGGAGGAASLLARARRNRALLAAALEGLREAAKRRAEGRDARSRLACYGSEGALPPAAAAPQVERRA